MGAGHDHAHGTATGRHRRRLVLVLALTLSVVGVQVVGGLVSGSLALLADAGHMLTDATGVNGLAPLGRSASPHPVHTSLCHGSVHSPGVGRTSLRQRS